MARSQAIKNLQSNGIIFILQLGEFFMAITSTPLTVNSKGYVDPLSFKKFPYYISIYTQTHAKMLVKVPSLECA